MCVTVTDFYGTGYKSWSRGMTNVSIPVVNMLKNSSTLAVSIPINLSIQFGSVSVNGHMETYFVEVLLLLTKFHISRFMCVQILTGTKMLHRHIHTDIHAITYARTNTEAHLISLVFVKRQKQD